MKGFIIKTISFPYGKVNKEISKNLSLSEIQSQEIEKNDPLLSAALQRSGMAYSSEYYFKLRENLKI